ncbi:MAG: MBL fold metallo-hydrolase [Myxococcota bacterium]
MASLAIVLRDAVHIIDATPDFRAQLDRLADVRRAPAGRVDRAPLDGILLTHAHLGHYTGLAFLGFEAVHAEGIPVWATPAMNALLRANVPFSELVRREEIVLRDAPPGARIDLGEGVSVTPVQVPHRDENADTVAFRITGPNASVLYAPDTDNWEAWDPPVEQWLRQVDVALLDGTFFSGDELPGRAVSSIGHPLIARSLERFAPLAGDVQLVFTHLNHSNPALTAGSPARALVEEARMAIAEEGATYAL